MRSKSPPPPLCSKTDLDGEPPPRFDDLPEMGAVIETAAARTTAARTERGGSMNAADVRAEFDPYLPLRDLSRYSGLGVRSLRGYLVHASHPLPHYRLAGKILVKRSEFDRWMQEYRRVTPSCVDAIVDDVLKGL